MGSIRERVLVFGGGWLGRLIAQYFQTVVSTVDITQPEEVAKALYDHGTEVAINAAAKTGRPNVDWCNKPENIGPTMLANTVGPVTLLTACRRQKARLVHLSTTYVFERNTPEPEGFTEATVPDLTGSGGIYSASKAAGDLALLCFKDPLILRINLPIGDAPHERNFITRLARYDEVADIRHSITTVPTLMSVMSTLIGRGASGVYHAVHSDTVTNGQLIDWYRTYVEPGLDTSVRPQRKGDRPGIIVHPARLINEGVWPGRTEVAVRECLRRYAAALKLQK